MWLRSPTNGGGFVRSNERRHTLVSCQYASHVQTSFGPILNEVGSSKVRCWSLALALMLASPSGPLRAGCLRRHQPPGRAAETAGAAAIVAETTRH